MTLGASLESMTRPSALVSRLDSLLDTRRRQREPLEREWVEAYRRYNNQYDPGTYAKLNPKKSRAWVGLTAMKVNAAHAAIMDLLSQGSWDLEPAHIPDDTEVHPILQQAGVTLPLIKDEIRRRTVGLKEEMQRQLDESDFDEHLDMAVLEAVITGSGAIRGPITERDEEEDWEMELGDGAFQGDITDFIMVPKSRTGVKPTCNYVSIFNLYPDMESLTVQRGNGIFEEMLLTRAQMIALALQPGIDTLAVLRVLRENPGGNANLMPHQITMRRMAGNADPQASKLYRVIVYHGPVSGQELENAGAHLDETSKSMEVQACVWYCGKYLFKARPYKGRRPYNIFPYVRRAGFGPFGIGLPMLVQTSQDAINAATRMMLDNAAIASGPFIEANVELLQPGENPADLHAWRVFLSKHDGENSKRAISIYDIPAYTSLFLQLIDQFRRFMDEESFIPSITNGMDQSFANDTATGASILNSNANRSMKQVMRNIDGYGIEPFIEAWYEWQLRYNPRTELLAKMKPVAKGVRAVMAKEVQAQKLLQFAQAWMGHPDLKATNLMREHASAIELNPDDAVATPEEKMGMTAPDVAGGMMPAVPMMGDPAAALPEDPAAELQAKSGLPT